LIRQLYLFYFPIWGNFEALNDWEALANPLIHAPEVTPDWPD